MLAICATLALTWTGCGDDGDATDENPLFAALQRVNDADKDLGVRYTLRARLTDRDGASVAFRGYGQIQSDEQRTRTVLIADDERQESFVDEPFELSPLDPSISRSLDNAIPAGTMWIKVDQDKVAQASGFADLRRLQNQSPAETLEQLKAFRPKIEDAGPERIGGVMTKRYRVSTTLGRILEVITDDGAALPGCLDTIGGATIQYVYWVDDDDLVRRFRLRLEVPELLSSVVTLNVTKYDRTLRVEVPDESVVYDATDEFVDLARSGQDGADDECLPDENTRLISLTSP